MLSGITLPISSQLSCYSDVSRIIIKTKPRKLKPLPPMELPSPSSVILYWGVRPAWTTDRWRGSCCSLQSPLSPSSSLILHSSRWHFWTAALRYCSLLHKHSCYELSPCSLYQDLCQPSNQSPPQAIWCRTSRLNWIEPAPLNVTLIVLNCLNSTLLRLFKLHSGLFHMRPIFLLSFVWVVENGVCFVCFFLG